MCLCCWSVCFFWDGQFWYLQWRATNSRNASILYYNSSKSFLLVWFMLSAWAQAGSVSVRAVTRSQRRPEQRRTGGCQHLHDGAETLRPPLHPTQRSRQTRPPESHQRGAHGRHTSWGYMLWCLNELEQWRECVGLIDRDCMNLWF